MNKILAMVELNANTPKAQISWVKEGLRLLGYNDINIELICSQGLEKALKILINNL